MMKKMLPNCKPLTMFCVVFLLKLSTLAGYYLGKIFMPPGDFAQVVLMGFVAGIFHCSYFPYHNRNVFICERCRCNSWRNGR